MRTATEPDTTRGLENDEPECDLETEQEEKSGGTGEDMIYEEEITSGIPFVRFMSGDNRPIMLVGVW